MALTAATRARGGYRPGAGRKPGSVTKVSAIRRMLRSIFVTDCIPVLMEIIHSDTAKEADKLRAVEITGRYGIGDQSRQELTGANGGPIKTSTTIELEQLPPADLQAYRALAKKQLEPSKS